MTRNILKFINYEYGTGVGYIGSNQFYENILSLFALIVYSNFSRYAGGNSDRLGGNIVLTNFKGIFSTNQNVDLSWSTMMESSVDYFEIQRSGDGINFEDIDSVQSKMKISTQRLPVAV